MPLASMRVQTVASRSRTSRLLARLAALSFTFLFAHDPGTTQHDMSSSLQRLDELSAVTTCAT